MIQSEVYMKKGNSCHTKISITFTHLYLLSLGKYIFYIMN